MAKATQDMTIQDATSRSTDLIGSGKTTQEMRQTGGRARSTLAPDGRKLEARTRSSQCPLERSFA